MSKPRRSRSTSMFHGTKSGKMKNIQNEIPLVIDDGRREYEAAFIGIILGMLTIIVVTSKYHDDPQLDISLWAICRFFSAVWCYNIANRQRRNKWAYARFAFFFPSIALIILGLLKNKLSKTENKIAYE